MLLAVEVYFHLSQVEMFEIERVEIVRSVESSILHTSNNDTSW